MPHASRFLGLVEALKPKVREISIETMKTQLSQGSYQLIDIREDHEVLEKPVIPGALHMGKGILERDIQNTFEDPNTCLILYCGGGYRSVLSADALQQMGYTNVYSMKGGFREWVQAGLPLERH